MASTFHFLLFLSLLSLSSAAAQTSFRPKALVLPVKKDSTSLQYLISLNQRTPLVPLSLTLDLGGQFLWVNCDQPYVSSTFRPARCGSAQCSLAGTKDCGDCLSASRPGCSNNTCRLPASNSITNIATPGELSSDVVSVTSTDGKNPGRVVSAPHFLFVCSPAFVVMKGLASGVVGMAGLGRTMISLPSQFSAAFSFSKTFAVCLSSPSSTTGVVIIGDGPYVFLPNIDASTSLIYTPLILNRVSTPFAVTSNEYFIGVTAIRITGKTVPLNASLLAIDRQGFGGTTISTVNPYTTMETSIYKAVTESFAKELAVYNPKVIMVAPVAPFGVCFSSKNIGVTRVGYAVPPIDLVLQSESVYWSIYGSNSIVQVSDEVLCLGIVESRVNPREQLFTPSVVIGAYQIEDNLLQFDLARSRLGFSNSLFFRRTTCGNFNFTSNA